MDDVVQVKKGNITIIVNEMDIIIMDANARNMNSKEGLIISLERDDPDAAFEVAYSRL